MEDRGSERGEPGAGGRAWALVVLMVAPALAGCLGGGEDALEPGQAGLGMDEPGALIAVDPNEAALPLGPGDQAFWMVPDTNSVSVFEYTIQVATGADRLRVAFDRAVFGEDQLELYDPAGDLVDTMEEGWSMEVFAGDPTPGNWTVRLEANDTVDGLTRMRAKLEAPPTPAALETDDGEPIALLPNLRPAAPLDFRFGLDWTYLGPGAIPWTGSCHPDEIVEDGATRCLRFAFGYGNIGDGPFEVLFEPVEDGAIEGDVHQRVHLSDGSTELREAGTYEYHATHGHYHYDGILHADLYRVLDAETGELEPIIEGAKRGACAHDWRIAHFDAFIAAPRGEDGSGDDCSAQAGGTSPTGARIGLSRGWTDLYAAGLQDNYVDGGEVDDGRYVLRVTIDKAGSVAETNETDNVGYAYIEVEGDRIDVLERGLGNDPWDGRKIVTEEWVP